MATPADEGLPAGSDDAVELSLRLDAQGALVSVDTSGELLHVRGARQETGKAPLRETLASGVLRLCEWAPGEPLWDIMCGSGTFLLEAAEQAQGLQPGRQRHFAFERFPGVPAHLLAEARAPKPAVPTWLRGSDLNAGALGVARRNARRAGIGELLQLERLDATALTRPDVAPGLVLANLPYGKRVGSRFELASLYARVGRSLKQALPGWRFGFLLQDGAESLGLDVARTVPVKNGGLSCLVVTGRV
jgi:putative N6-adenine-specific DNA methylase